MRLILAIFLPWLQFFTIGRPVAGIVCLILQVTVIGWIPAAIWSVYALSQYETDKKIQRSVGSNAIAQAAPKKLLVSRARNKIVFVSGSEAGGWRLAKEGDPGAAESEFRFYIASEASGGFSLNYESTDFKYVACSKHPSLGSAVSAAQSIFGISPEEWG